LTAYRGLDELPPDEVDELCVAPLRRPVRHAFSGIDEVRAFLQAQASADPTFEGVVIRDRHGSRWKGKSAPYLGMHHLATEGPEGFAPKHLLPFILAGEGGELLAYFPEVRDRFQQWSERVESAWQALLATWQECWAIEDQKTFAQAIQKRTPFTG